MTQKKKSPKNRREAVKHPGLKPRFNLKRRQELFDQDYIEKLSEEEKDWLNRFNEEFINANFKHSGERIHKTDALKKDCEFRNNHRNMDIYTKAKASGTLDSLNDIEETEVALEETDKLDKPANSPSRPKKKPNNR